ncbi:hypothetical protein AM1_A0056 (plasmid) [Acaryochloris marina MBIC11017]|uniref:Uncharacterized protein n=1 Tax=Acaryochloris marina (strain MBIC 11017) TaxID=329726 RepID=A8ZK65_ACAM1|nr:hypothetical protein AM1_A0056 [Acaryochloris marina MBIC11017]
MVLFHFADPGSRSFCHVLSGTFREMLSDLRAWELECQDWAVGGLGLRLKIGVSNSTNCII